MGNDTLHISNALMDLHNNDVGLAIGSKMANSWISNRIMIEVVTGYILGLPRDSFDVLKEK